MKYLILTGLLLAGCSKPPNHKYSVEQRLKITSGFYAMEGNVFLPHRPTYIDCDNSHDNRAYVGKLLNKDGGTILDAIFVCESQLEPAEAR